MENVTASGSRVLVTGARGFVGGYLIPVLESEGYEVYGLSRGPAPSDRRSERWIAADLTDAEALRAALKRLRPSAIVHLAAQSSVPRSFREPLPTLENNILGAAALLYAAAELSPHPTVLVIGSPEEYGRVTPKQQPLRETHPLQPVSPYGVSKAAQSLLALSLYYSAGLPSVVIRPFNHTGPGQSPQFVLPAFAQQVARIEAGLQEPVIRVGNLEALRDFTDVQDIVRAYSAALRHCPPGRVYNLGSGRTIRTGWLLDELLKRSRVHITVEADPGRMTPSDIPELRADPKEFITATGWQPAIPLEQTVADVLEYWRERVRDEAGKDTTDR